MKTMMKMMSLLLALVLMCACFVGCSSAPAKPSGDESSTKPTEELTVNEQEVFAMLDLVDELALGMKTTNQQAVAKAAAMLDMCEKTAVDDATVAATAKKYYDTFGSEFRMMFDEKLRLVAEASESLRDEATRAAKLQEAEVASEGAWSAKAFDMVKAIYDSIKN